MIATRAYSGSSRDEAFLPVCPMAGILAPLLAYVGGGVFLCEVW